MEYRTIENEWIAVKVNLHGGCLASIVDKETEEELLYQPDPRAWGGQDIFIFPFIARLKNKTYTVKGKEYTLDNHGLARYTDFYVIEEVKEKLILGFDSSEETLKRYPFHFHTAVTYEVEGKCLKVTYLIQNLRSRTMVFGLGAHPALKVNYTELPDCLDTSGNFILFPEEHDFDYYELDEKGAFITGKKHFGKLASIETNKQLIKDYKTLILDASEIREVFLKRRDGRTLTYTYPQNIKYIAIWSFPEYGDYICIEPWVSLPDFADAPAELSKKQSLVHLKGYGQYTLGYTLDIGHRN